MMGAPRRGERNMGDRDDSGSRLEERTVAVHPEWRGVIFGVERRDVELPDGSRARRDIVRHSGGVGVIAIDEEGRLCLVRQWRICLDRVTLEIPAGKLEPGEDPADAARRELAEETGIDPDTLEPFVTEYGSPGFTDECTRLFIARGLHHGEPHPDAGELVDATWTPVPELVSQVLEGRIQDAKTIIAIFAAASLLGIPAA
jgi:ADP-ribose pyrophosphatase